MFNAYHVVVLAGYQPIIVYSTQLCHGVINNLLLNSSIHQDVSVVKSLVYDGHLCV